MTERVDLFTMVHKGLRWWLGDVIAVLGSTDFTAAAAAAAALDAAGELLVGLDEHGHHEDMFIAPLVRARAPERAVAWEADHVRLEGVQAELRRGIARLRERGAAHPSASAEGLALYRAFNRLAAAVLAHLDEEETVIMPLLWASYRDDELVAVMTSFKARFGAEAARFHRRAAAAYAPRERALLGL